MQTGKVLLPLLGAITLGTGAALLAGKLLEPDTSASGDKVTETYQNVVVADADITYGQEVSADKLALKQIPVSLVSLDMFRKIEEVSGKIASDDIFKGEPILTQRLASNARYYVAPAQSQ